MSRAAASSSSSSFVSAVAKSYGTDEKMFVARVNMLVRRLQLWRTERLVSPKIVDRLFKACLALVAHLKHAYRNLPDNSPIRHIVSEAVLEQTRLLLNARFLRWPTLFIFGVPKCRRDTAIEFARVVGDYFSRCADAYNRGQRTHECSKELRDLVNEQYCVYFV